MLVEVAGRVRAAARESDLVARVGGDEFVVLLTDLDPHQARSSRPPSPGGFVRSSRADRDRLGRAAREARIGISIYPTDSRDAKGLLAAADAAMYASKHGFTRVA